MNQTEHQTLTHLQSQINKMRDELQMRDQLVQQLSQELFRLVKGSANFAPKPDGSQRQTKQIDALRNQLQEVEQQVGFYQEQLIGRDTEIYQLRQTVQEMNDRAKMLEQVVQQLPQVYRQKFAERMNPIKEKVAMLQKENRRLHAELQSVSYRLALRNRNSNHLDLPSFPKSPTSSAPIPTFGT